VAKLPSGELLLTAFFPGAFWAGPRYKTREDILSFRSNDEGKSWSGPENLTVAKGLRGREPYFTILADGTILMTVHFLTDDVRIPVVSSIGPRTVDTPGRPLSPSLRV